MVSVGAPSRSGTAGALLRAGVLAGCALGALGLALPGRLAPRPAVRVLDVSASMGRSARGPAGAFQAPGERLLVADGVRWATRDDGAADLPRGRTRLAQALTEAGTRFPRGPGRVWLVSDGRDTEGGALEAAAALAARGVAVDVSAPEPVPADVGLVEARVLSEDEGGTVVLARLESSASGRVRVALREEAGAGGALDAREVVLTAGVPSDVLLHARRAPSAGPILDVLLTPLDGTPDDDPDNDRLALAVPGGDVRLVFLDAKEAAAAAEGRYGPLGDVSPRPPTPDEVEAADAIVVGDVSARRLGRGGSRRLLHRAARGGVVIALGGPESFGPGGWAGTAFEAMLPLRSPSDSGETAVVLCLDASGSTGETPPGAPTSSREALLVAVETLLADLPAGARVAVLPFRSEPFPSPLSPAWAAGDDEGAKAALTASLRALLPEGGTDLPRALVAGARLAASRTGAKRRIVLLATDGDPDHAPGATAFAPARAALLEAGAELAAVVRGDAPAAEALRDLAGGPRRVALIGAPREFADALARVLAEAARGREVVDGPFAVTATPGSGDDAGSLAAASPRRAHLLEAAPGARVLAEARRDGEGPHPFAATRAMGAGLVGAVAWGPALEEGAAADAARRALGPLLARLARRGDRGLEAFDEGGDLVVRAPAGLGALRVRRGESGEPTALIERESGLYRGPAPFGTDDEAAPAFAEVSPGAWRPLHGAARPAVEHRGAGVDGAALAALARAGGGRRLPPGEPAGAARAPATTPLAPALLSIAVVLFVAERSHAARALSGAAIGSASAREAA